MKKKAQFYFIFVLLLVSFLIRCGKKSDFQLIKQTIEDVSKKIEKKDKKGFLKFIDEEYFDNNSRSKEDIRGLIDEYYYKRRGIVINLLSSKITNINIPDAEAVVDVAVSSGAAKVFRKLANYYGDYYRVEITLIKRKNRWFIKSADWHWISFSELFPESLKILKKIMPEIYEK